MAEENLHLPFVLHAAAVNDLCKRRISIDSQDCSTVDDLKQSKVPVLFVHGADHTMSYCVDMEAYQKETVQFWEKFDNK